MCGRKRYEYFERLTFVRLIRGLSVNVGRVKEKGNEVRNTLEGLRGLMCRGSVGGGRVAPHSAHLR